MQCVCMSLLGLLGMLGVRIVLQVGEGLAFRAFPGRHFASDIDPTPKVGNLPELAFPCNDEETTLLYPEIETHHAVVNRMKPDLIEEGRE